MRARRGAPVPGAEHPSVTLRYAWPFELSAVVRLLAAQLAPGPGQLPPAQR